VRGVMLPACASGRDAGPVLASRPPEGGGTIGTCDAPAYRQSSFCSRRTASLAGFLDLSHVFDGLLR
jgi:hypothetical protein